MQYILPNFLEEKLKKQYSSEEIEKIINGYTSDRIMSLRINTIKTSKDKVENELKQNNIKFTEVSWYNEALIIENINENDIRKMNMYTNGEIYLQSLSSMIPVIVLEPKPGENILDMAAAPGGKTTQISAITNNQVLITACEKNKIRADRLRYNLEKQGAIGVNILNADASHLDSFFSFDRILLDAPCSGSGTINLNNEKDMKFFSEELINRSVKTQFELLKKAIQILKPGHEMVYSTCSILREENEENIKKILKNNKVELIPINRDKFKDIEILSTDLPETITVTPTEKYEGFFVAKLRKI